MNWESLQNEAILHLQNLIRINTTNPPGNEIEAVRYLSEILKKEGVSFQIFEPSPGRGNLVARLKGNGQKSPLLLTSHLDVVPADASFWKYHPFSGDLQEGCVWGRGAVDMKQMTAMELTILLAIKREGVACSRDIIFAAVADEEAGCRWGSQWLVANKPELFNAEYALNEVGGFSLYVDGADDQVFYPIGVAERGVCWLKLTAEGKPGHGSIPHEDQANVKMAEAVSQLGRCSFPLHENEVVSQFIRAMAAAQKFPRKQILKLLLRSPFNRWVLNYLIPPKNRAQFRALLSNTASPTILRAGTKINVIPSKAELEVDGRILAGQTVASFLNELTEMVGVELNKEILCEHEPNVISEYDNDFYQLLTQTVKKHDNKALPVPYMCPGFTDAAYFSTLGIKCYGFAPVRLDRGLSFSDLFHGHNERIPVKGFLFGLKVLMDVVGEWCQSCFH